MSIENTLIGEKITLPMMLMKGYAMLDGILIERGFRYDEYSLLAVS